MSEVPRLSPYLQAHVALPAVPALLKEIGRGERGSRGISRDDAGALFAAMLDGTLPELETGAALMAWRMKGESADELEGALLALQARIAPIHFTADTQIVSIPSYNGARKQPNLSALLACALARAGLQVIVHGVRSDERRVTTFEIFEALGLPIAGASEAPAAIEASPSSSETSPAPIALPSGQPLFVPIDLLSPSLARVLALRDRLGVRHLGHTLVKLLDPLSGKLAGGAPCLRLCSHTHPEFQVLQQELMRRVGARALQLRGTEGEAVLNERRRVRLDWIESGACRALVDREMDAGGGSTATADPGIAAPAIDASAVDAPAIDARSTARFIDAVLRGDAPMPAPIALQVDAILGALRGPGTR